MKKFRIVQLCLAIALCLAGLVLLFAAFWVPPLGVIDPSVLVAFGEVLTFSGALLGMDYRYGIQHVEKGGMT